MKIEIRRNNYFQSDKWNTQKNPGQRAFIHRIPPKDTPTIEILYTEPPKYRINGQIVSIPLGMTPKEYYEHYMKRSFYQDNEREKYWFTPKNKEQEPSDFVKASKEPHPLRKQYLESRLNEISYQERAQTMQDNFTTAMYGKKDYTEEKNNIINELNRNSTQERTSQQNKTPLASKEENFTPAPPDEPSDFDRRKKLWEEQNKWDEFQKSQHKGQSVVRANEPNAFERLGITDPKNPPESISEFDKAKRDFYKFPQSNGTSTEEWNKKNEEWRNTPRKDKDGNILGSQLRCNTTFGRELSKLGIDVEKDASMNDVIDCMDKSDDWANLPTDKKGNSDHKEAIKLAKEGYIVVATEKGKEHGHAAILTGKEVESGTWKGKVPEVYGSVNGKPAKAEGISIHWQAKDKNNIEYKVYRFKRPI